MTESRARRDLDFDYVLDDPDDNNGWYGQAQAGDATVMHEVDELERDDPQATWQDDPDTDRWYVPAQEAEVVSAPEADDVDPRHDDAFDTSDAYDKVWDEPRETRWDRLYAPRNGRNGSPRIGEWNFTPCPGRSPGTTTNGSRPASSQRPRWRSRCRSLCSWCAVLRPAPKSQRPVPSKAPTSAQPAPTSAAPALSTPAAVATAAALLRRRHPRRRLPSRTLPGSTTRSHVSRRPTNPTSPRSA